MKLVVLKSNLNQKKQTGFSLIEVIVAIYILLIGIVGVMALTINTTKAGAVSSSKLIAANLAQEGIEVVKNIRDLNYGENGWADWHAAIASGDYLVQYNSTALISPYVDNAYFLYDTGLYNYDTGSTNKYKFKRKITIENTDPSYRYLKVISTVGWIENSRDHSLVVEEELWNWR